MTDLPKNVTVDLSKDPALAAVMQALLVAYEQQRQTHVAAYEEYQERLKQQQQPRTCGYHDDGTPMFVPQLGGDPSHIQDFVCPVPPPPTKLDIASLALATLKEGVAGRLQRHDVLDVYYGPGGLVPGVPLGRHIHRR